MLMHPLVIMYMFVRGILTSRESNVTEVRARFHIVHVNRQIISYITLFQIAISCSILFHNIFHCKAHPLERPNLKWSLTRKGMVGATVICSVRYVGERPCRHIQGFNNGRNKTMKANKRRI